MRIGVLGAGPAAGAAALDLARGGFSVTVFRPGRPGEKPCGGALPGFLLSEIPEFDATAIPSVESPQALLENADGAHLELELAGLRIFRRCDLDPALLALAEDAGAAVVPAKAERLELGESEAVVGCAQGEQSFDWLVAADGARGLSRRTLGLRPGPASLGLGASLEGLEAPTLVLGFPDLADAYLWIFPRPGGCSVGIAYSEGAISTGAARRALTEFVGRHLGVVLDECEGRRYRYPIPIYSPTSPRAAALAVTHRVLLVGDAVGVADPLTREGIRPAVRSARLAADCLLRSETEAYPRRLARSFDPEMNRASRLTELFYEDPIGQWMIPVCRTHPGVRRVLSSLLGCQQPYTGLRRRLLRALVDLSGSL